MRNVLLSLLLVTAAGLSACGKPAASGATSASPSKPAEGQPSVAAAASACDLVTAAEIEAATGVKVGLVKPTTPTDAQTGSCEYQHADTASFGTAIIAAVAVFKPAKIPAQEMVWTKFMKSDAVDGVGDVARYNAAGGALFVRKGDKAVYVQVLDAKGGDGGHLDAVKKIASIVLSRS